jgi:tRNA nucleotidyltransferase (CCA-adding enzyme)
VAARLTSLGRQHPYRVTAILKPVPPEGLVYLYAISPAPVRDLISLYLKRWRHVVPSLTGGEIASMGIGEGPLVGKILSDILRLRLAGRLSTRNDELAYVRERIRQHAKA